MNLSIDKSSPKPVYEQICLQISELITGGLLAAGSRMPSVRQLASSLGLSKNTVAIAYDELVVQKLIETRHGSGTYVCTNPERATTVALDRRQEMLTSLGDFPPLRWEPYFFSSEFFFVPYSKRSNEMIRFTQAYPDPSLFPFERIKQVATNMLWYPQEFFFDIGRHQGYQPLVEYLEKEMAVAGVPMAEGQNDIILTGGFQRALSLLIDFIIRPGQKVAIESPSYSNLLNLLVSKRIDFVPIPVDSQGMDTEYLAGVLGGGETRAVITTPTFHNPTGVTMSLERREHLLRLAMQHRIPVIEDDWGSYLRYEGADLPTLKSMDTGGYVIHVGTFSKCFLPGLRIGWITCPSVIGVPLVRAKTGADCGDSYFLQALLFDFISKGYFHRHIRKVRKEYKKRRDVMCNTLRDNLPSECKFSTPQGGFSVWIELPKGLNSLPILNLARIAGVDFCPAAIMMPDRKDAPALRLSFSRNNVDDITRGVHILCKIIRNCVDHPELIAGHPIGYEDLFR